MRWRDLGLFIDYSNFVNSASKIRRSRYELLELDDWIVKCRAPFIYRGSSNNPIILRESLICSAKCYVATDRVHHEQGQWWNLCFVQCLPVDLSFFSPVASPVVVLDLVWYLPLSDLPFSGAPFHLKWERHTYVVLFHFSACLYHSRRDASWKKAFPRI